MDPKPIVSSKTVWTNAIFAILAFKFPPASEFLKSHPDAAISIVTLANILLRILTKNAISLF